jgi:hypothetical protein
MTRQVIALGTTPNDHTGTPLNIGGDMINDNFKELYDKIALYEGTGIKFITKIINAKYHGDFQYGAVTVIPTPGPGKVIKVIDCMLLNDPTTPLDIGGQILNVCYGNPPDGTSQNIGYFPSYYLKSATLCLAGMEDPSSSYKDIGEDQAVGVGLSGDADVTSGQATIVIFMWYYEVNLLGYSGIVFDPGPKPVDAPIVTTITTTQTIDGSKPLYVAGHPTTPIVLSLDDISIKGNVKVTNNGAATATLTSLTGPGTVLIAGLGSIDLNQYDTVELQLVNLDGTLQFVIVGGKVTVGV